MLAILLFHTNYLAWLDLSNSIFCYFFICRDHTHLRWISWVETGFNWHALGLVLISRPTHLLLIAKVALTILSYVKFADKQYSLCKLAPKSFMSVHILLCSPLSSAIIMSIHQSPLLWWIGNVFLAYSYQTLLCSACSFVSLNQPVNVTLFFRKIWTWKNSLNFVGSLHGILQPHFSFTLSRL